MLLRFSDFLLLIENRVEWMKQYGSYPITTHVTALLHPVTKKHLMSVVAQHGGPYAKVSNTWGKDYGHYYDNLGDDGWPQGYWGGKK